MTTIRSNKIAILGWMYSGKGTLATAIKKDNSNYNIINFGDPLKVDAARILNAAIDWNNKSHDLHIPHLTVEGMEEDKHIFRPFYQWYSDTFWKSYMGDVNRWLRPARAQMEEALRCGRGVICADVRYTQEYSFLQHAGFTFIRVIRPEADRQVELQLKYGDEWEHIANHPGEHYLDEHPVDYELFAPNEQTIYEYAKNIKPE